MPDIQWNDEASLLRITRFATTEPMEALVARGTPYELLGMVLEMAPAQQADLLLRQAGADWVEEYDADALRELAARPEYTGAHGADDTADLGDDPDRAPVDDEETLVDGVTSGPSRTDALGRDGAR